MEKHLNNTTLTHFWQKLKQTFVKREEGKGLSSNDYTDENKASLVSIKKRMDSLDTEINNMELITTDDIDTICGVQQTAVYIANTEPTADIGKDGDVYIVRSDIT